MTNLAQKFRKRTQNVQMIQKRQLWYTNLKFVSNLSNRFKVAKFGRKIFNAAKKGQTLILESLFRKILHIIIFLIFFCITLQE